MHRSHSGARWLTLLLVGFAVFAIGACSGGSPSSGSDDNGPDASAPPAEPTSAVAPPSALGVDDRPPNFVAAPADTSRSIVQRTPRVGIAYPTSSPALADLPSARDDDEREESEHEVKRIPRTRPRTPILERQTTPDPVAQVQAPVLSMPVALVNVAGQGSSTSPGTQTGTPPDTNGAVGPNHFVQVVNGGIEVWNKSGTVVAASKLLNTLWSTLPAGDPCRRNDGDPVVLYDQMADRWFVTQFALPNQNRNAGPSFQCIAVSKTPDPTGAYWLYEFSYPYAINDYGKFGVWPDAYYAAFHMFGAANFRGDDFCAYDRAKMLAGSPATQQCFFQAYANPPACPAPQPFTVFGAQPVNMDGPIKPPVGTPGFFLQFDYSACNGPYSSLDLWKLHVDFTTPASSTVTGPTMLTVAGFTPTCDASGGQHCVPEPGNVTLDAIDDRMMFRLTYRNFGTHESLMVNHSVVGGAGSGVRWYEIRSPNAVPVVYQQGTYAPADTNWRWMGSLAQDQARGVALGFSLSSLTQDPSIGWTGRLATDALGVMGQGETVIATGTAVELDDYAPQRRGRWGDYSNMTVDPVDDCTFWYTTELFHTAGRSSWDTQIASVKFPTCAANDFSIGVSPATQNLNQGGTVPYTVTTTLTRGVAERIVLNVQDLPTGVTGVFVPPSVTAGQTSTLTLTATGVAPLSTTTFTVIGTAPSAVHAATARVVVVTCVVLPTCPGGQNCGTAPNGCGGTMGCGNCTAPQTCGGGGTANHCGCTPISACGVGQTCGTIPDSCGGLLSCGICASNQTCTGNACVTNVVDAGADSGMGSDSGTLDSGTPDSSVADSGAPDSSIADSGAPDSSVADSATPDSSIADSGAPDARIADSGAPDSSVADSGAPDSSVDDSGTVLADAADSSDASASDGSTLAGGGCNCRTVDTRSTTSSAPFGLGGLAILGVLRWRRRSRRG